VSAVVSVTGVELARGNNPRSKLDSLVCPLCDLRYKSFAVTYKNFRNVPPSTYSYILATVMTDLFAGASLTNLAYSKLYVCMYNMRLKIWCTGKRLIDMQDFSL